MPTVDTVVVRVGRYGTRRNDGDGRIGAEALVSGEAWTTVVRCALGTLVAGRKP